MKLIPTLSIGLFNAWIPLILYSITIFGIMFTFNKDIRKKFFGRSNIPRRYLPIVIIHKSISLFLIILFFLSPIAISVPILEEIVAILNKTPLKSAIISKNMLGIEIKGIK